MRRRKRRQLALIVSALAGVGAFAVLLIAVSVHVGQAVPTPPPVPEPPIPAPLSPGPSPIEPAPVPVEPAPTIPEHEAARMVGRYCVQLRGLCVGLADDVNTGQVTSGRELAEGFKAYLHPAKLVMTPVEELLETIHKQGALTPETASALCELADGYQELADLLPTEGFTWERPK